ncbi:MAG: peptidase C11, partial [Oscillospiraceae bacterium]|nr:peptidase C11 [Oscillospiraceae bacterium]
NANLGTVNSTVASGARAKRTVIRGNGQDTVTIMVYMCGTDLESKSGMATKDLLEMVNARLSDNVHVLVYTGGCTRWNNQVVSSDVNQIYEIVSGGLNRVADNAGRGAMTNPATLTTFIQWCAKNYPANRNELIFWDHGGGSVSGYGYDQKNPSSGSMTLAGINQALKDADVKFDMIGFDTCLMATMENALMLDDYADYMVASEETEPGLGWYYTNWLTKLSSNPSMDTVTLGKTIVDDFVDTCASQCRGQSATLSVVDLAELAYTTPTPMKAFSQSMTEMIGNNQYQKVSNARNGSREFARSSAIDQVDLVHFAKNLGNAEGARLASAIQGAVKYNRTSSDMTNSYGLSIYFPYRKASNVDKAVSTYDAIGMDESYSQCIREFASLEVSGQAASGGYSSALPSLLGTLYGNSYTSGSASSYSAGDAEMINALLQGFLGGGYSTVPGLSGSNTGFLFGRSMSFEDTAAYVTANSFDPTALTWTLNEKGEAVISLPPEQWALVEGLDLNLFYDDGEGYVDMGLDNVFTFDDAGNLLAETDRTWLAVDGQPVAYYHEYTQGEGDDMVISGRIPAFLTHNTYDADGQVADRVTERVDLLVCFDAANPHGTIVGARPAYVQGETEAVAKNLQPLEVGDVIDFVCDFYTYDGDYENSYYLGDPLEVTDSLEISNVDVGDGSVRMCYRFTDLYQQHYWSEPLMG